MLCTPVWIQNILFHHARMLLWSSERFAQYSSYLGQQGAMHKLSSLSTWPSHRLSPLRVHAQEALGPCWEGHWYVGRSISYLRKYATWCCLLQPINIIPLWFWKKLQVEVYSMGYYSTWHLRHCKCFTTNYKLQTKNTEEYLVSVSSQAQTAPLPLLCVVCVMLQCAAACWVTVAWLCIMLWCTASCCAATCCGAAAPLLCSALKACMQPYMWVWACLCMHVFGQVCEQACEAGHAGVICEARKVT